MDRQAVNWRQRNGLK